MDKGEERMTNTERMTQTCATIGKGEKHTHRNANESDSVCGYTALEYAPFIGDIKQIHRRNRTNTHEKAMTPFVGVVSSVRLRRTSVSIMSRVIDAHWSAYLPAGVSTAGNG